MIGLPGIPSFSMPIIDNEGVIHYDRLLRCNDHTANQMLLSFLDHVFVTAAQNLSTIIDVCDLRCTV